MRAHQKLYAYPFLISNAIVLPGVGFTVALVVLCAADKVATGISVPVFALTSFLHRPFDVSWVTHSMIRVDSDVRLWVMVIT